MRTPHQIIAPLLFVPFLAHAGSIDLVCTDNTGFSVTFEIDISRNIVMSNGIPARNVYIDKGSIRFVLTLDGREWFHVINRSTGNMAIQGSNKIVLSNYVCEKAKSKF